jgi:hypothetical protein
MMISLQAWARAVWVCAASPQETLLAATAYSRGSTQVRKRPAVVDDRVEPRPLLTLYATFDHRLMDGYQAGKLAQTVKAYLAAPAAHEPPLP